jgi:hypothetical protein
MKLRALAALENRPIHAYVNCSPNHVTVGFLALIPYIEQAIQSEQAPYDLARDMPPHWRDSRWSSLDGCRDWNGLDYIAVCNGHLERGERIETFWPELDTEHDFPLLIPEADRQYIRDADAEDRVLLYPSGVGPNNGFHRGTWEVGYWVNIICQLNAYGIKPLLVGADTKDDLDYAKWIERDAKRLGARYDSMVGRTTIPQYVAAIEAAKVWVGLNSGGGIVSAIRRTPTVMLWSDSACPVPGAGTVLHTNMKTSWLKPDQLPTYRTLSYGSPALTPDNVVKAALEVMR